METEKAPVQFFSKKPPLQNELKEFQQRPKQLPCYSKVHKNQILQLRDKTLHVAQDP